MGQNMAGAQRENRGKTPNLTIGNKIKAKKKNVKHTSNEDARKTHVATPMYTGQT